VSSSSSSESSSLSLDVPSTNGLPYDPTVALFPIGCLLSPAILCHFCATLPDFFPLSHLYSSEWYFGLCPLVVLGLVLFPSHDSILAAR
jgi:hypothetical protein